MKTHLPSAASPNPSLVAALMLLFSCLSITSTTVSGQPSSLASVDSFESWSSLASQASRWDWASLADSEGYVDVILIDMETDLAGTSGKGLSGILMDSISPHDLAGGSEPLAKVVKHEYSRAFNGFAARLTTDTVIAIQSENEMIRIYPDIEMRTMAGDNIRQVGADLVWALDDPGGDPVVGSGIVVAVIDTGVDYTHPDLGGGFGPAFKVIGGYDFINSDGDPLDDHGHGTHVAGIVAASGGISGVAPEASILAYKVLDENGFGSMSDVIAGIEAAMDPDGDGYTSDHADVISMSLGGAGELGDPLCLAVSSAVDAGIVVVVAAGNDGPHMGTVSSPGLEPTGITVGAIDSDGVIAGFSSRGTSYELLMKPEISAPGVDITSTVPYSGTPYSSPTGYLSMSGTSMATPHVSGVAALLLQLHPNWTPGQVKSAIMTGSGLIDEPAWHAGTGSLWAPSAAEADLFLWNPMLRSLAPDGTASAFTITNDGAAVDAALDTIDFHSVLYNGSASIPYWTNVSTVSSSSLTIAAGGSGTVDVAVVAPAAPSPEGYYDGALYLSAPGRSLRIPFGFVVLSHLNVHVLNRLGAEVSDSRGISFVYSYPDASVAQLVEGIPTAPSPPASFRLPSGAYAAHALGHQVFYSYSDPYVLTGQVELGRMDVVDLYLRMADARVFTLNVTTNDGNPIFVKDFLMYCRYVGDANVSGLVVSSDGTTIGTDLFSLGKSRSLYISDTDATVGIFAMGFSYSADMWDFMSRNWDHWYEHSDSTSTEFLIESTADLQYLLSWEFEGVDSSCPVNLGVDMTRSSVFETKYDILGTIDQIWTAGTQLTTGGQSPQYVRRTSYTSLNPFFSGMTRTTIVQGVFYEKYWPGSLSDVCVWPTYYVPDYTHRVVATAVPDVYLPDRMFLLPIEGVSKSVRVGAGPFYPSIRTMNTESVFAFTHPLLRDQGGSRVTTPETPWLYLYRNGAVAYSSNLREHLGNPDPQRVVAISGAGNYRVIIPTFSLASDVSNTAKIILGFSTLGSDMNPPTVTGFLMPQRFVPGESISLELSATDDYAMGSVNIRWRPSGSADWRDLAVEDLGSGDYGTTIGTSVSDYGLDLMLNVSDTAGNYIEYTTTNASLKQVPILFDLSVDCQDVSYVDGDVSVVISGHLTGSDGMPLSSECAVPIDLMLNDRKVAMVLDEFVGPGSHTHNGTIRFEWHLNPARLFTGPNETIAVRAEVDLGIYQPISDTIYLHSVKVGNNAPSIRLLSPSNGSIMAAGQVIDLSLWDDGEFTADAYLDGAFLCHLTSPWDIETSSWAEGLSVIEIVATDVEGLVATAAFEFEVDAFAPSVSILYPDDGGHVPQGSVLRAEISDSHLVGAWYSVDGQPSTAFTAPYEINMVGWVPGSHVVEVRASDEVGHVTSDTVSFTITWGSIVVDVLSPQNGSVIRSGTPILVSVTGDGTIAARWTEGGEWFDLASDGTIPTDGWPEGWHQIAINATNDLGEFDEYELVLAIDDTPPEIILSSPANNSYVNIAEEIVLQVNDANLHSTAYALWDIDGSSADEEIRISLSSSPCDGIFGLFVSSVDMAGNVADASFIFAMDSSPPEISADGFESGDAIASGQIIDVTAADTFLSAVEWSLDYGPLQTLSPPYEIDTSGLSGGQHGIMLVASDYSGKKSYLNLEFYIDVTSPVVWFDPSETVNLGEDLDLTAVVSDDFAVGNVTLYYEVPNGSYCAVPMVLRGTEEYAAELVAGSLWDGMTVFVVAEDSVGNLGESMHAILSGQVIPDDARDDSLVGVPAFWIWLEAWGDLLMAAFVVAASVLTLVFMTGKRRPSDGKESDESYAFGPMHESIRVTPPPTAPPIESSPVTAHAIVASPAKSIGPVQAAAGKQERETSRISLVDAIPELVPRRGGTMETDSAEDIDYGEMIERELNLSALSRSVFREEIREEDVDRELELLFGGPEIVSGLELKKLMDMDRQKM